MLISLTEALSLPKPVSDGITVFTGASSSSAFGVAEGEVDGPKGISDCRLLIDVVTTGATETGLDGSPWLFKDELSALAVASVTGGVGEGWVWECSNGSERALLTIASGCVPLTNASGCVPRTIDFSTCSRANLKEIICRKKWVKK